MAKHNKLIYHLMAIFTAAVWGTTFVSTKSLINNGLTPVEIMFYRFVLAYICLWTISYKILFSKSIKDEFLMLLLGLTGGSLYFLAENNALEITQASNVSLIICTTPVLTTLLTSFFFKEKLHRNLLYGSFVALFGVAMVVFSGSVLLKINPLGDFLTFTAALLWAFYSVILRMVCNSYPTQFITRKVFFYGILSLLVYHLFSPFSFNVNLLTTPVVYMNLIYLGIIASMLCYILWNLAIRHIGASRTTNYIYLSPLVTVIASVIFLSEVITPIAVVGTICIIGGVYFAEKQ